MRQGTNLGKKKDPCLPSVSHIIFYLVLSSFMFRVFPPLHNLLFFCLFFFLSGNTLLCERVFAYLASVNIHLLVCRVPTLDDFFLLIMHIFKWYFCFVFGTLSLADASALDLQISFYCFNTYLKICKPETKRIKRVCDQVIVISDFKASSS